MDLIDNVALLLISLLAKVLVTYLRGCETGLTSMRSSHYADVRGVSL